MPTILGRAVPDKEFSHRERDVPNTPTDRATVDTWVHQIRIVNRTAGAITFTLKDKDSTPFEFYDAVSIDANSVSTERLPTPLKFTGGITVEASAATGLNLIIEGWQRN